MFTISFEGMDGSGKTTLAKALTERLEDAYNLNVKYIKFPVYDEPETGTKIRNFLDGYYEDYNIKDIVELYERNRENVLRELDTKQIDILVLDRYILSNITTHVPHESNMREALPEYVDRAENELYHTDDVSFSGKIEYKIPKPDLTMMLYRNATDAYDDIVKRGGALDVEKETTLKRTEFLIRGLRHDTSVLEGFAKVVLYSDTGRDQWYYSTIIDPGDHKEEEYDVALERFTDTVLHHIYYSES